MVHMSCVDEVRLGRGSQGSVEPRRSPPGNLASYVRPNRPASEPTSTRAGQMIMCVRGSSSRDRATVAPRLTRARQLPAFLTATSFAARQLRTTLPQALPTVLREKPQFPTGGRRLPRSPTASARPGLGLPHAVRPGQSSVRRPTTVHTGRRVQTLPELAKALNTLRGSRSYSELAKWRRRCQPATTGNRRYPAAPSAISSPASRCRQRTPLSPFSPSAD